MPQTYSQRKASSFVRYLEQYHGKKEHALHLQDEFAHNSSCISRDEVSHKLQLLYDLRGRTYVPNLEEQAQNISQITNIDTRLRDGDYQLVEDVACAVSTQQVQTDLSDISVQTALQFCHLHAPEQFPEWDDVTDWFVKAYQKSNHLRPIASRVGQIANKIRLIIDVYHAVRDAFDLEEDVPYDTIKDRMYDILLTIGIKLTEPEVLQHLARGLNTPISDFTTEVLDEILPDLAFNIAIPHNLLRTLVSLLVRFFLLHVINHYGQYWHEQLQELQYRLRTHAPPANNNMNA